MQKFIYPKIGVSMLLATMVVAVLFFINDRNFDRSSAATLQIESATKTLAALNKLQSNIVDAESGQRGYLLTGDEMYLPPYSKASVDINNSLEYLRSLVSNHPREADIFQLLARHVSRKLAELELTLRLRKDGNHDAWKYVVATDAGRLQMDYIRQNILELTNISEAKVILAKSQIQRTLLISRIGIALFAMTGLLAFYLYLKQNNVLVDTALREKQSRQREREQVEAMVKERTENLTKLATHLQNTREDERGDLARDLHDEFGSLLTSAKLDLARLKSQLKGSLPDVDVLFTHLNNTLNCVIAMTRTIVEDLRPSSLSHLGLTSSLEILGREFQNQHHIDITFDLETVDIGGNTQLAIYRLVQESLTNISKYACAKHVLVSLHALNGYIAVQVKDDGIGFDMLKVGNKHHGLLGMQHRVESLGGKIVINSVLGQGTKILATLPSVNSNNT